MDQPPDISFSCVDDIFIKVMYVKDANTIIPQHSHKYDHTSMLAIGSVEIWANGKSIGQFKAPAAIPIRAHVKHRFLTLVPHTTIYCIHNVSRTGEVDIESEHQIGD